MLYVIARLISVPFRRLQKSHLPQYAKLAADTFLKEISHLEGLVEKSNFDGAWKQKVNFGLKDAVDHIRLSMK